MFETLEDMREKSQRPMSRGTALFMYSFDFVLGLFYIISGMPGAPAFRVLWSECGPAFDLAGYYHTVGAPSLRFLQGREPDCR
jgi:hypothetical protein